MGEVCMVPHGLRCCLGQRMVLLRPNPSVILPEFLLYSLLAPQARRQIGIHEGAGSTVSNLRVPMILRLQLDVPPLREQKRRTELLVAIDDKIESLRRMNHVLESWARLTFQSWFLEFQPTRALAAGRLPVGVTAQAAVLFPACLTAADSEGVEVPEGWRTDSLDRVVRISSGGTPDRSKPEFWGGDIPWFSIRDAPRDSDVYALWTEESITRAGIDASAAKVLSPGTTILSARGTVGKLAIIGSEMAINQSCYGVEGASGYPPLFTYFMLKEAVAALQQRAHGSVFDTISRDTFKAVSVVVPPTPVAAAFDDAVRPALDRIRANLLESRALTELHRRLVPKLVSGSPLGVQSKGQLTLPLDVVAAGGPPLS